MQTKASADLEARIEAASRTIDRHVNDMLDDLEDDVRERDYEERLHALRTRSGLPSLDDGW